MRGKKIGCSIFCGKFEKGVLCWGHKVLRNNGKVPKGGSVFPNRPFQQLKLGKFGGRCPIEKLFIYGRGENKN
jgi:hypothetical protein